MKLFAFNSFSNKTLIISLIVNRDSWSVFFIKIFNKLIIAVKTHFKVNIENTLLLLY
jgi:hypothetical protein